MTFSYTAIVSTAHRSQENDRHRSRPAAISSSWHTSSNATLSKAVRIDSTFVGSKYSPAGPTTSGMELVLLHTTAHPQPIASKGGMPNPSYSDGYTNARAPA